MKKTHLSVPTVCVGIPALNEEGNIAALITSILKQRQMGFTLHSIVVVSDGSTDQTVSIVRKLSEKHPVIICLHSAQRRGKAVALNKIYKKNQADLLLTMDADIVFESNDELTQMVAVLQTHPNTNLVGARHVPVLPSSVWGKFAYYSYLSFEDAFLRWKNGHNYYAVMAANVMRTTFAKSFSYPEGTVSDQCYLYAQATRNNQQGFRLVKSAHVLFRPVNTFMDWRLLGVRSTSGDKDDLAKHFGQDILSEIAIPKRLAYGAQLRWLIRHPFYMGGSIMLNVLIRLFPYTKTNITGGMWEPTHSSKAAIPVNIQ